MKRKGLTILLFSMMALAATPRAAHHFQNYVAAAQNQAQVELLHLLLDIGAPAEESQAAPQNAEPAQAASAAPAENDAPVATVKQRNAPAASSVQPVARKRNFEFTFADAPSLPAGFAAPAAAQALEGLRAEAVARRHVFVNYAPEMDAVAPSLGDKAKGKAVPVKALLRAAKLDEKAACALEKELAALVKGNRRALPVARLKAVRVPLDAPAAKGAAPVEWEFTDR